MTYFTFKIIILTFDLAVNHTTTQNVGSTSLVLANVNSLMFSWERVHFISRKLKYIEISPYYFKRIH